MKNLFIIILLGISISQSVAQGTFSSDNGLFTVDYLKGCVGTEITVSPADASIPGTYFLCFDADVNPQTIASSENNQCFQVQANTGPVEKFSFIYDALGEYDILVFREASGNNTRVYDSISVSIIEPEAPTIGLANCNGDVIFNLNPSLESYDQYTIDFGDGNSQTYPIGDFPVSYTYADNTVSYTATISGDFDSSGFNNCTNTTFNTSFTPQNLIESAAEINALQMQDENTINIEYQANPTQLYTIQIDQNGNGNYQDVEVLSGQSAGTYAIGNLNLAENYYTVRIVSESICSGNALISNAVNTILLSVEATFEGNQVAWNSVDFVNSVLLKDGVEIYTGESDYLDINVLCGQEYTYQLITTDVNNVEITSLPISLTANNGSPSVPITMISTNVLNENEIEISWQTPDGLQPAYYNVYKKRTQEDSYGLLDSASVNTLTDFTADLDERNYYYSVTYLNDCAGESRVTVEAPNILLQAEQTDNILQFRWNEYTGYDSLLMEYRLVKYDVDTNFVALFEPGLDRSVEENVAVVDEQVFYYQVQAEATTGDISYSNLFRYKVPPSIQVPSAFTPDGDGLNEEIRVRGKFIENINFKIFNRWGTLIFNSNSLAEGWDGFLNNREAAAGTYSYLVTVTDPSGEQFTKTGVFTLIRRN